MAGDLKFMNALPSYLGSKRKLGPLIFRKIAEAGYPANEGHVLLDAFMGGGNVALYGKALGYRVAANDVSVRSEAIGKALVENSSAKLASTDVAAALLHDPGDWHLPDVKYLPWPDNARRVLARIASYADTVEDPWKRHLLRCWMVKTASGISFWGQPRMTAGKTIRDEAWDKLTPGQAASLKFMVEPLKVARNASRPINMGVFSNGHENEMHCADVLEFLSGRAGDVAYFDPPYPGTESYEKNYVGIDAILTNTPMEPDMSRFSRSEGWKFLSDVFDAAADIPVWVLSLGNAVVGLDELSELIREKGRVVDATSVKHAHMASKATEEFKARNLEFVLVGRKA